MRWRRRRGQRGQALPISALCAAALLGGAALAVDLSLQAHRHRDLQNASDAAALAGARDLGQSNGGQPNQADRNQAAVDALRVVYDHMGWGTSGKTWATGVVQGQTAQQCGTGASATHCDVTTPGPAAAANVSVTVDVPPLAARNPAFNEQPAAPGQPWGYIQVDVVHRSAPGFGGAIGAGSESAGAHSIAYHFPAAQPFGFALFSNTTVSGGNQGEIVQGHVYAYRDVVPQSNGLAGFCAAPDPTGTPSSIVLGAPQSGPFPSPDPAAGRPYQANVTPTAADVVHQVTSCSTNSGGTVNQTAPLGGCGTLTVQGASLSTVQDASSLACVASPPLLPPDLQGPTLTGSVVYEDGSTLGANQSVLTVNAALAPGVYYVTHNAGCVAPSCTDVVIDGRTAPANCPATYSGSYTTCLIGVTFWLAQGATIGVSNGARTLISPYQPPASVSQDPNDGFFSVYAPIGSGAGVYETNVTTLLVLTGTVYLPSGTVSVGQNALFNVQGQVITNVWNVQSGNAANPEVSYSRQAVARQREQLQLVE